MRSAPLLSAIAALAGWIAREAFGASEETARQAETAGRLAKTDLTTDMVRELPELQGRMGGIAFGVFGLGINVEETFRAPIRLLATQHLNLTLFNTIAIR